MGNYSPINAARANRPLLELINLNSIRSPTILVFILPNFGIFSSLFFVYFFFNLSLFSFTLVLYLDERISFGFFSARFRNQFKKDTHSYARYFRDTEEGPFLSAKLRPGRTVDRKNFYARVYAERLNFIIFWRDEIPN